MGIERLLAERSGRIDALIEKYVPRAYDAEKLEFALGPARYSRDVRPANEAIAKPVWELLGRGGKRWRPVLFSMVCEALGGDPEKYEDLAVIFELVHNGCLPEDAKVLKNPGEYVSIAEIKKGDNVYTLSKEGRLVREKVLAVKCNGVQKVFRLKTRNREIRATANHQFLVLKKSQPVRYKITQAGARAARKSLKKGDIKKIAGKIGMSTRVLYNALNPQNPQLLTYDQLRSLFKCALVKLKKSYFAEKCTKFEAANVELEWRSLGGLRPGDIIAVLRKFDRLNEKSLKLPSPPKNPPKDKAVVPEYTSEKFCQLCGYILGDGVVVINKKSSRTILCTSGKQDEVDAYSNIFYDIFGYKIKSHKGSGGNLTCSSYKVAWLLKELGFKKKAVEKEIPQWVLTLPEKEKLAFVRGFIDSDGWVNKHGHACFASSSKKLIECLKLLLDGMGFTTGHILQKRVKNKWKNSIKKESVLWGIKVSNPSDILRRIGTEKLSYRERLDRNTSRRMAFEFSRSFPNPKINLDNFRFDRIKEIKPDVYEKVYDITVENSHNFIANNIVVHNSLVADDVEDGSELRRGRPCLHRIFGVDVAVNVSSAMYYLPLLVLLRNRDLYGPEKALKIYEAYSQELINIHFGQAMDIAWHNGLAGADSITEKEYLQMCAYKTGTLARLAAKVGAIAAGADHAAEKMGTLAESMGIGFQIQDDVLNLTATSGKNQFTAEYLGSDISEGKRTLMVIHALSNADEKDRQRLVEILNAHTSDHGKIAEAVGILEKCGSVGYARSFARSLVLEAWNDARGLLKDSPARNELDAFVMFAVERGY